MNRCFLLLLLVFTVAEPFAATRRRPNFVVIVADDMGFSDAGCYGGEIQTPNLDRLAANGLRFTQFYNTARCWPSRASILTGYYAQQVRRDALPGFGGGSSGKRPAWARLLPEYLKPFGYRSYHSGKWHVDGPVLAGGFDRSYSLNDHDRNFYPRLHTFDDQPLPPVNPDSGYYSTTAIAQHAIDMLGEHGREHSDQPFLLYLCFTVPHFPLHALPQDIEVYKGRYRAGWDALRRERYGRMKQLGLINTALSRLDPEVWPSWNLPLEKLREQIGPVETGRAVPWDSLSVEHKEFQPVKMAIHAAMVHRMDLEIGRVLDQLRRMGAFENTLVLFLSDNGASAEQIIRGDGHDPSQPPGSARTYLSIGPAWSSASNTPFRLHKSWVHEGGISTPLIAHWPQGIAARGELRHTPGHLIDLPLTILELAGGRWPTALDGGTVPSPPGRSLVPVFARDGTVSHDYLWWYHDGNRAIRVGDWKLVADHDRPWELYDLRTDRAESNNLAAGNPAKVRELGQAWTRHMEEFSALVSQGPQPEPSQPSRVPHASTKGPDWLLDPTPYRAQVKSSADGQQVELSNGLIRRVIRLQPNAATVAIDFDGTWTKTPSMGWMFVPLTEYHGGGAAATIEPLREHLDTYAAHLANSFGAGVEACYRGPRLFDSEETKQIVRKWVSFFKSHRDILESDIIHLRRADGRDLDYILHVNPALREKGLLMVYYPLDQEIRRTLRIPLYYTGLTRTARIRLSDDTVLQKTLDRDYQVDLPVRVAARDSLWAVIE